MKKFCFRDVFLVLLYLIPKLSNFELLTPPHPLLVTVYVPGILQKSEKYKFRANHTNRMRKIKRNCYTIGTVNTKFVYFRVFVKCLAHKLLTKSVCGGVRSSKLDILGMRYNKKRKMIFYRFFIFIEIKYPMTYFKNRKFSKSHFFQKRSQFSKKYVF